MTQHWIRKFCKVSAWLLVLAIVVLSLIPPSHRPITQASHAVEHFLIFFATGFGFGVGYPSQLFASGAALAIFCGVIELAQKWVPGRHARFNDFFVDTAAACIGLVVASAAVRFSAARPKGGALG